MIQADKEYEATEHDRHRPALEAVEPRTDPDLWLDSGPASARPILGHRRTGARRRRMSPPRRAFSQTSRTSSNEAHLKCLSPGPIR